MNDKKLKEALDLQAVIRNKSNELERIQDRENSSMHLYMGGSNYSPGFMLREFEADLDAIRLHVIACLKRQLVQLEARYEKL